MENHRRLTAQAVTSEIWQHDSNRAEMNRPLNIILVYLAPLFFNGMIPAQNWVELSPTGNEAPAPRRNAGAIYDPIDHRMIVFGGRGATEDFNDIWAFALDTRFWSELTPSEGEAPAPRQTPGGIYDVENHRLITWSGQGSTFYNDVWAFDLDNHVWSQFHPPAPQPNPRYGAAYIFDPRTRQIVTFAGFTNLGRFNDTWRFDVATQSWIEATSPETNPLRRCLHSGSYDSRDHRMIMYGGQLNGALGDIWALDLNDDTWRELTPLDSPEGRYFAANIYDRRNHRVIIFGGNRESGGRSNEVWAFDLAANAWQLIQPSSTPPAEREGSPAIYIEEQDRIIIFGGMSQQLMNDVWALNGLSQTTGITDDREQNIAWRMVLYQNCPNPFNPSTTIRFWLSQGGIVSLMIYNTAGQLIKEAINEFLTAGIHEVVWDGRTGNGEQAASGVFFYRLEVNNRRSACRKMMLIK